MWYCQEERRHDHGKENNAGRIVVWASDIEEAKQELQRVIFYTRGDNDYEDECPDIWYFLTGKVYGPFDTEQKAKEMPFCDEPIMVDP